jgi:EAL domain-containing protein (putative c-di-GMP-specific phosphodiesterase class I)
MYQAKRKGGARHQVIDLREQHQTEQRASLEHDLLGALARGELRTEYQPIVETGDGRITSVEALLRWAHPSRGLVAPTLFIPLAEQSDLITEIGRWVLEQACRDRHRWRDSGKTDDLMISVNVSSHQVMSSDFVETVATVLSSTDTDPKLVTLEVTESVFVQDLERALVVLRKLKDLGVKLALDDFGTGYSSLNYLKRFPIDTLKIDQSFVQDITRGGSDGAIVSAVIAMGKALNIRVIAEGVETQEQLKFLTEHGCHEFQGYLFSRPMAASALTEMIHTASTGAYTHRYARTIQAVAPLEH